MKCVSITEFSVIFYLDKISVPSQIVSIKNTELCSYINGQSKCTQKSVLRLAPKM